jgi:hypothetical protein
MRQRRIAQCPAGPLQPEPPHGGGMTPPASREQRVPGPHRHPQPLGRPRRSEILVDTVIGRSTLGGVPVEMRKFLQPRTDSRFDHR